MLEGLKNNISKLIALYEKEKQRADSLEQSLAESRSESQKLKEQINELKQQIDSLKLTSAFTATGGDNSAAKERIDKLVREIDKCIDWLES